MVHKKRGRPLKDVSSRDADRQKLIKAAVQILEEGSAAALTARAVADRAGTAVGSVYTTFASLDALWAEANIATMERLRVALVEALQTCRSVSIDAQLTCLADAYMDFAETKRNAWTALFERRSLEENQGLSAEIAHVFSVLEAVIEADGRVPAQYTSILARALWSSVHGMIYLGSVGGLGPVRRADIKPMIDVLVRTVVAGLPSLSRETASSSK